MSERHSSADLDYRPGWMDEEEAAALLTRLHAELDWRQRPIVLFGREVLQPRLTAWYGDPGVRYRYSGVTLDPLPWHPVLADLRDRLAQALGVAFNSVLANAYRDGGDSMGWHADDEPELGPRPVIASLSLGATRRFRLRPRAKGASKGIDLEAGSLLVMRGDLQRDWQHALPKTRRPVGLRLNLTYRRVLATADV